MQSGDDFLESDESDPLSISMHILLALPLYVYMFIFYMNKCVIAVRDSESVGVKRELRPPQKEKPKSVQEQGACPCGLIKGRTV